MNWKEELEKVSYDIDDEDLKNEPVIAYSDAVQIVKQAIQTRERELREEWQKLETISKEVEIDNLAMQYELGREDREREISEEVMKMSENGIPNPGDAVGFAFKDGWNEAIAKIMSVLNHK